jgi:hypothetical protein
MGSSFLTAIHLGLSLYCVINFLKMLVQFGLPNHPGRFTLYLVSLCACAYFSIKTLTEINVVDPFLFMRWRALPLVAGSLGLLLQVITIVGTFSLIQQKIISRIPLIAAVLFFAFFSSLADYFFIGCILVSALFLTFSVGKARYQKRMLLKMTFFLSLYWLMALVNNYWVYILGELFLFPALFYFFIFQQSYGVSALVEAFVEQDAGVPS